jgi:DNA-binding MarR family transcriptional regulator
LPLARVTMGAISPPIEQYRAAAALRAALRRFSQASEHALALYGLTSERYELLLAIKDAEGGGEPATVSELATALGVAQSSVTQLVRRAENAGLLRREVSIIDARVRYLRLTAQGERQLASAVAALHGERTRLAEIVSQL